MRLRENLTPQTETGGSVQRNDRAIEAVNYRLQHCQYRWLRRVWCELRGGTLTLCGMVPTYFLKQTAQVIAAQTDGAGRLDNQIAVQTKPPAPNSHP